MTLWNEVLLVKTLTEDTLIHREERISNDLSNHTLIPPQGFRWLGCMDDHSCLIALPYHFQCWDDLNLLTFSSCSPSAVSLTAYHLSIWNVSNLLNLIDIELTVHCLILFYLCSTQGQCLIYSIEFVTVNKVVNCCIFHDAKICFECQILAK